MKTAALFLLWVFFLFGVCFPLFIKLFLTMVRLLGI